MKAATIDAFGELDQLTVTDIDPPEPVEGELLVRVEAAGVNPVDTAIIKGYMNGRLPHEFPLIPGWDLAGVVEERGFGARRFEVGDRVYGYARRPVVQWGTFSEQVVIPESYLSRRPENVSAKEAGGIPLVGLTAYQSLYEVGDLQEGETVLILGASGGVGSMAIQLAKIRGARAIGVASAENHAYMKKLGADATIDYRDTDIGEVVREIQPENVDLIFDCAAGKTLEQSLPVLKSDGKLVSILSRGDDLDSEIDHRYVFVEPHSRQLDHLRELTEAGELKIHVSNTYDLEQTVEALIQIETGHTKGKIVILP